MADAPAGISIAAEANDRGADLYNDYRRTSNLQLLQSAITLFREAVDAAPVSHPGRPQILINLANALQWRFWHTGQLADLDQAITSGQEAVDVTPAGHPDRPLMLSTLGAALGTRFEHTGRQADLDQAIATCQKAIDVTPAGHPDRPLMLSNVGAMLRSRFARTSQLADLDQAVATGQKAVDTIPVGHPDRLAVLSNLGAALQARFERTGQLADLDQAIATCQKAIDAAPADHPGRAQVMSNLGNALRIRFRRTGQPTDLDRAIITGQEAIDAAPADHPSRGIYLNNIGIALWARFWRTGQQTDLDQAIALLREAIAATPDGHPYLASRLSNLGGALGARFRRTGQLADLDQSVTLFQQAAAGAPAGRPDRPMYLSNLGNSLQIRFGHTGQQADLDRAIAAGREAVGATPAGQPNRAGRLSILGSTLATRFAHTGQLTDLDQGITLFREATAAAPADDPDRPRYLSNLGNALDARFDRTRQQADLDQAIAVFREGAGVLTASPGLRIEAARRWGQCALLAGTPQSAAEGYAAAIELLPLVAWHGLDQATREHHLREWAWLASDAAAAMVAAGHPARAVELLEAGRSLLWTQALHLRQDLAALRERAPELAAVLEASRTVLNTSPASLADGPDAVGDGGQTQAAQQPMLEERRQAARDWDAAVAQIRRIEGFEHFLRPIPFTDLRAAADGGPVVIVNISRHGSHALIVTPAAAPGPGPAVLVVALPGAPAGTVIDQANALLAARYRTGDPTADWQAKENDRHAVFNILAWCWQAITEPVLTALGHTHAPARRIEDWPRVWWCPTGPATVLPLHAAGRHPRTATQYAAIGEAAALADSVAGRMISSYTSTLTTLTRARTRATPGRVRQLAVGVSEVPGFSPLPAVSAELHVVARHLPAPDHATHLPGPAATRQAVLEALPGHSWLHLSCHGVQHPADASLSAFLLYDQPLTLADLASLNLRDPDLAYLAACQTAAGDVGLPDEALHLAGALQLVGYRHVLATLWSISDAAAPGMAEITYAHLLHPDPDHPSPADRPQAARASYALHHAVTSLRQAYPGEPLLWAPYIYLGP
jgi:tetratricopeptide (TPR) repeat protein